MKDKMAVAEQLIREFKGDRYIHGLNCMGRIPALVNQQGATFSMVVADAEEKWMKPVISKIHAATGASGLCLTGDLIAGAKPNAPVEDVYRIASQIDEQEPEVIIAVGGGSTLDAVKAAGAYHVMQDTYPNLNDYFGQSRVEKMLSNSGRSLIPVIAIQMASSSAAHLTKYSNITDLSTGQKMLIVDEALVPPAALFDYGVTVTQPLDLTRDGGLDGISHCLEVYMGIGEEHLSRAEKICLTGIDLICANLDEACRHPDKLEAREAIGLGTDLGGYAIMVGGTNGAHLNSFSMTDILSHGRACSLMNPYYVVFFSPRIEKRLMKVAEIYNSYGYLKGDYTRLKGKDLGMAVAGAMMNMSRKIGFPLTLSDVKGFSDEHIRRCLQAAKNPKLESKLKNMPVSLSADMVDEYMGSVLEAAKSGDLSLIKTP